MPPRVPQTLKRYRDAIAYAPSPGFESRWPPGTWPGPDVGRQYMGPIRSRYMSPVDRLSLSDGDGLGGLWDDLTSAAGSLAAPATAKLDRLEMSIKAILVLSGIAAATGLLNAVRR
jgi:hypothetical protein